MIDFDHNHSARHGSDPQAEPNEALGAGFAGLAVEAPTALDFRIPLPVELLDQLDPTAAYGSLWMCCSVVMVDNLDHDIKTFTTSAGV